MNKMKQETIDTYNESAEALSEYFRGIGPRTEDIEQAFKLAGDVQNPRVVEIGCGDGRDAKEITTRTNWYLGFDVSESMINLAKQHVADAEFEIADAVSFTYPPDVGIVFAFASLLHLDKDELETVFYKVAEALRPKGIFYISTKYSPEYREEVKEDQFGKRLFYFYNQQELEKIAGTKFAAVYTNQITHGNTDWIEIAFQRVDEADV
jgi:predicted TPR repeat methyltransferase